MAVLTGACTLATAQSPDDYHMYFTEAFARYGEAVEACESRRDARKPPSQEVISKVGQYELQKARVFLIYNDFKRMQECSSDAAVEILVAAGSLRNKEESLLEETRLALESLEENLFIGTDLAFEMKYRELPEAMRNDLERLDYFQSPFQAYSVLDEIESQP
ncbi:MAG: hypothetical protein HLX50_16530 [Alteromonadaceae bacterium]|nr:hypothetical protein [Alteromonadaceae bacterium]